MPSNSITLIYPHQLFEKHPGFHHTKNVVLLEDPLHFSELTFHKKKIVLHRAAMKAFEVKLLEEGYRVTYASHGELLDPTFLTSLLRKLDVGAIHVAELSDDWLEQRLASLINNLEIKLHVHDSPGFICNTDRVNEYFRDKKRYYFTDFYTAERKRSNILLTSGGPTGGKWTFDTENRKKLPKSAVLLDPPPPSQNTFLMEATGYVNKFFDSHPGSTEGFFYPVTHAEASKWLDDFLTRKFRQFGDYEDAITTRDPFLFHSMLSAPLNCGLITPLQVITRALAAAEEYHVPINSLEGFIRQVMGWREYMRAVYLVKGRKQRTSNFFGHTNNLPKSFWDGTTGIAPLDSVIKSTVEHSYCHHIERLMILGNIMVLLEISPDEVYRWFMEFFIDSYDWVMVPNVYGMSQFADGGMMTTKPYISSSNYILKMSDFRTGEWCPIWDALYWRFINKHKAFFKKNPRLSVMSIQLDKMGSEKLSAHEACAEKFMATVF